VDSPKKCKVPPRRFHPKGLAILHEDRDIVVVDKVHGLLTMANEKTREHTAYYLLNEYVRRANHKSRSRVFIVHRLDRDTSGVLVFAKNEHTKRILQDEWHGFKKKYIAVVQGNLQRKQGIMASYLIENSVYKMVVSDNPRKGKLAKTGYKVLRESKNYSLIEIDLFTGRKNQIRVHFAEEGHPVCGDKKYGTGEKGIKRLTLHSSSLTINHPHTKEQMTFEAKVPDYFYTLV